MIVPTPVFSPVDGAVGCDYLLSKNQLIFVEFDGNIDLINLSNNTMTLGDGTLIDLTTGLKKSLDVSV